ncbi:hypothetical protein B0H16DRAFT_1784783 [Mycena metata]|uniref:Uncharacterized protein n=1 Tax=Mycena metata TaxID=1033252 RepID=A0AAD7P2A4_9AGAR|nr:hypothetical protein B0H16DRAFT_1784783 [Mycena metata]
MSDDNDNSDTDTGDRVFNIPDQNATPRTLRRAVGDAQKLLGDVLLQNKQLQAEINQAAANKPRGRGKGKGKTSANTESGPSGPDSLGYHSVITKLGKSFSILVFPFIDGTVFSAKVTSPVIRPLDLWKPNPVSAELPRYLTAAIYAHVPEKYHSLIDRSNFPDFAVNFIRQGNAQRSTSLNTIKTHLATLLATVISNMKDIHDPVEWQALVLFPGEPEGEEISGFPPILYPDLVKDQHTAFKTTILTESLRCILFGPASMNGAVPGSAVLGKMWNVQKVTFGAISLVSLLVIFHCYWRARLLRNPDEKVENLEVIGSTSKVGWQEIYLRLRRGLESRVNQPSVWTLMEFWHQKVFAGISVPSVARPQRAFVRDEDAELEEAMGAIDLGPDDRDDWNDMEDVHAVGCSTLSARICGGGPTKNLHKEWVSVNPVHPAKLDHLPAMHNPKFTHLIVMQTSKLVRTPSYQSVSGPRHQASGYRIPAPAPRRWPAQNDYDRRDGLEVQARFGGAGAGAGHLAGGAAAASRQNEEGLPGQDYRHRTVHRGPPEPASHRSPQRDPYNDNDNVNLSFDPVQHDRRHRTVHRGAPEPASHRSPQHPDNPYADDESLSFDDRRHRTKSALRRPAQSFARNDSYDPTDDEANSTDDEADNADKGKNRSIGLSRDQGRGYQNMHLAAATPVLQRRPAAPVLQQRRPAAPVLQQRRPAAPVLQRRPAAPVLRRRHVDSDDDEAFPIGIGQDRGDHATVFPRRHAQEQVSSHERSQVITALTASSHSASAQDVGEDSELDESLSAPIRRPMPKMRSRTITRIEDDPEPEEDVQHAPPVQPAVLTDDEMRKQLTALKVTQLRDILFDVKAKIANKAVKADLVQLVMENNQALEVYKRLYTLA